MDFDKLRLDDEVPAPKLPDLSRVMTLPTEIRALIFEQVVSHDHLLTYKLDSFMKETLTEAVQPALTRVSRQIRAESLPLFYESNDFVLHTEGSRSDDARRWLRCNAQYLPKVRCISFWLRYVPAPNMRSTSQGAFSLSIRRPRSTVAWAVEDSSRWITVVRKPADLDKDVEYLTLTLGNMLEEVTRGGAGPNDYYGLMMDSRMAYLNHKTSKKSAADMDQRS